jgi:beta-1,4-N-acetylglucosaminyltransferase
MSHIPRAIKRTYMFSSGDSFSAAKAAAFEQSRSQSQAASDGAYSLVEIPRARKVGQSWLTTPWSCIVCLAGCLSAFRSGGVPDVVVCNGPGSAVMMVAICFVYKVRLHTYYDAGKLMGKQ